MLKKLYLPLLLLAGTTITAQVNPALTLNETRSFEVSACKPSKKEIIAVWMEKRPERKDNDPNAADMRAAYRSSVDNGKTWTAKGIIDLPGTFGTGNPFIANNAKGEAYIVVMHIGKDFYSGNISLYEFDRKTKQFSLKSVPVKSDSQLLDKPSIVCSGNEIHLVYNAYSKRGRNAIKYQMSPDKGKTWTDAVDVFKVPDVSYLGPSISISKQKQILVATGTYAGKNIYLAKKRTDSLAFGPANIVAKVPKAKGMAMTEFSAYKKGMILTWQNAHQRGETWMISSTDDGDKWTEPFRMTEYGNLLSAAFDQKGNIHAIYTDFGKQQFHVGYKMFDGKHHLLGQRDLLASKSFSEFSEYLGAYQKLLVQGKELFAFWIDYSDGYNLKFNKWKN